MLAQGGIVTSAQMIIAAEGGDLTYQWEKNDMPIDGATSATLTITSATSADAGSYRCAVTSACGSVKSASATVNVGPSSVTDDALRLGIAPHPVTSSMILTLEQPLAADAKVVLADMTGVSIATYTMSAGAATASMPVNVAPGLYTITVQSSSVLVRRTVIVR
jgi:hypothetical protein